MAGMRVAASAWGCILKSEIIYIKRNSIEHNQTWNWQKAYARASVRIISWNAIIVETGNHSSRARGHILFYLYNFKLLFVIISNV